MSNRRAIDYINNQRQEERERQEEQERRDREQAARDARQEEEDYESEMQQNNGSTSTTSSGGPCPVDHILTPAADMVGDHNHFIVKLFTVFAILFSVVGVALNFDIFNGYFPDRRLLILVVFPLIVGFATFLLLWAIQFSLNITGLLLSLAYSLRSPMIIISIAVAAYFVYPYILPT